MTNEITTSTNRTADVGSDNRRDSRQIARRFLDQYHRANARLIHLRTKLRRAYAARRQLNPTRTESRALLVEFNRLAGRELIEHKHPFWATVRCFLSDVARERKPIVDDSEMLLMIEAARIDQAPNKTVHKLLDQLGSLVRTKENPSS